MQRRILVAIAVFFSLASQANTPPQAWAQKMQRLSLQIAELMPLLATNSPPDGKSLQKLKAGSKAIAELAHQVKKDAAGKPSAKPDLDPSLALLSTLFEREAKNAAQAFKSGYTEYGKSSLRFVTSYCISCHTRTDNGPDFPVLPLNPKTDHLNRMERAQLFAATRQFDRALTDYESVIADPTVAQRRQIEWGRAVRQAFTIAVRVQQDPDRAVRVLKKVESLPSVPGLFREFVDDWKRSIAEWKREGTKKPDNAEAAFEEVQRLTKKARAAQKYPMDHSADVDYLRTSLAAHDLLNRFPDSKHVSETLLMLGDAYDLLDDHLVTPLPQMYYETCIRKAPHTQAAENCYRRYQANVYFGYTGSSGTSIPDDVSLIMKELKDLAKAR